MKRCVNGFLLFAETRICVSSLTLADFGPLLADNMPDQLIVKAFGDIPEELVDVEKLLQEAGLSCAGKAPHRGTEKDQSAAA